MLALCRWSGVRGWAARLCKRHLRGGRYVRDGKTYRGAEFRANHAAVRATDDRGAVPEAVGRAHEKANAKPVADAINRSHRRADVRAYSCAIGQANFEADRGPDVDAQPAAEHSPFAVAERRRVYQRRARRG